jgi:phosphoglycerol transferase MdoB-like AlkP superfamily enzyme
MRILTSKPSPLSKQVLFLTISAVFLLLLLTLLRVALLLYNFEQAEGIHISDILEAFRNGLRFDLQLCAYIFIPLTFTLFIPNPTRNRIAQRAWLFVATSITILIGLIELVFYREFHQRINSLVFQYMQQDPKTVLSMLWHGFPVLTFLGIWGVLSYLVARFYTRVHVRTQVLGAPNHGYAWGKRVGIFMLCGALIFISARSTLRQGAPLRWGDAFTTNAAFTNQLGLNGTRCLIKAAEKHFTRAKGDLWDEPIPQGEALSTVRALLVTRHEKLIDEESAAVRRIYTPPPETALPVQNVVVILMESFSANFVGAMGDMHNITPYFDQLASEGLLFTRFFANGTHTHQGLFATMTSFPNLPGYEYLMQLPEGTHKFSGLANLLTNREFNNLYAYNGDFAWDNQFGFFSNQGIDHFVGRSDFVNPVVEDPTWGVSDQDMFARAAKELEQMQGDKPFFALVQTLSNHTPYALPDQLPTEDVEGFGSINKHLTAMRYSDWALGQFFKSVRKMPFYSETMFVIVGDHGFADNERITEMDLNRFHVPLLILAPGIQKTFGTICERVGSQVDVVPTIMGRLGAQVQHQCWGRDLLALPPEDPGFAIIKPSGSDQSVAMIEDDNILVWPDERESELHKYNMPRQTAEKVVNRELVQRLSRILQAYIQTATQSLQKNSTGFE